MKQEGSFFGSVSDHPQLVIAYCAGASLSSEVGSLFLLETATYTLANCKALASHCWRIETPTLGRDKVATEPRITERRVMLKSHF